ncbi:MAG: GNAT family N-acetyltransferase [Dehalococcoidia bacterium]
MPEDRSGGTYEYQPVTRERWPDLDRLFSASAGEELGNPSRCWCMELRRPHDEWEREAGEGNRRAMEARVEGGDVPGILAYAGGEPAGWCSVSSRPTLSGLIATGGFRNPRRDGVWSVTCFYVPEPMRGRGLMKGLVRAALAYALERGAKVVEAYTAVPEAFGDGAGGSTTLFAAAGFVEVARVTDEVRVMRYFAEGRSAPTTSTSLE